MPEDQPERQITEEEGFFDIERIFGERRMTDGTTEYFVQWTGFGEEHNSWQPEANFQFQPHREEVILSKIVLSYFCPNLANKWVGDPRTSIIELLIAFIT